MWKSKKFVIIGTLIAVAVLASTTGAVLAAEDETEDTETQCEAMLERVCEIYEENTGVAINADDLQDAFTQANSERRDAALQSYLEELVEEGTITQEEADEYLEWWQQKPDIAGQLGQGPFGLQRNMRHRLHPGPGCGFGGWGGQEAPEATN